MCRCFLPPGRAAFLCMVPPTVLIAQHVSPICSLGNAEMRAVHQTRACGAQTCQCQRRVTTSDLRLAIKTVRRKTKSLQHGVSSPDASVWHSAHKSPTGRGDSFTAAVTLPLLQKRTHTCTSAHAHTHIACGQNAVAQLLGDILAPTSFNRPYLT